MVAIAGAVGTVDFDWTVIDDVSKAIDDHFDPARSGSNFGHHRRTLASRDMDKVTFFKVRKKIKLIYTNGII